LVKIGLISFGVFLISLLLQYTILALSKKYQLFIDSPKESKPQAFHSDNTPRSGGLGIAIVLLFFLPTPLGWKLLLSLFLAFLSGIFEDFSRAIKPEVRLILQFIAAICAVLLTHSVMVYFGFGITVPYIVGAFLSILGIVGLMNAVNFIDGFNGLASGIVLLMLLAFGIVAYQVHNFDVVYIASVIFASVLAFFLFNFPHGKIFLGDGGAYLLGAVVAIIGAFLAANYVLVSPWFVLAVLIYPVWELFFSIIRKLRLGNSPFQPDSRHLHMLVFRHITHSNPLTALMILGVCAPFILLPTLYANNSKANFLTVILFIIVYMLSYSYLIKKEKKQS